jgi:isocitrate lyase
MSKTFEQLVPAPVGRFDGISRPYSPAEVEKLRGSVPIAYTRFMQQDHADALRWYREALALYTAAGSEEKQRLTAENVERLEAVLGEI